MLLEEDEKTTPMPIEEVNELDLNKLMKGIEQEQLEEDDEENDDEVIIEGDEDENDADNDNAEVEEPEEETSDTEEDSESDEIDLEADTKGKQVPMAKYIEERKKRQEEQAKIQALELQLKSLQPNKQDDEVSQYRQSIVDEYTGMGYESDFTESLADKLTNLYKLALGNKKEEKEVVDKDMLEIIKLKSESTYYDNADSFADKIKESMKKHGVTAKQAYNMLVEPTVRQKELEQRTLAKGTGSQSKKESTIQSKGGSSSTVNTLKSQSDRDALKMLQESFPNDGWDEKKYLATRR